jgi:hypothetical protein
MKTPQVCLAFVTKGIRIPRPPAIVMPIDRRATRCSRGSGAANKSLPHLRGKLSRQGARGQDASPATSHLFVSNLSTLYLLLLSDFYFVPLS